MTESTGAYRPQHLDPGPPPPRNTGVPESSIAGGLTRDKNSEASAEHAQRVSWKGHGIQTATQQSQSSSENTSSTTSSTSTQPSRPATKSRFRARKAAMTLTPTAVEHVRELLDSPEPKLIRIGVKSKGCSGQAYHLEYVDKPAKFDETVEQDGVKVLIDSKALIKVIGSEMDWVEDKLSARFTFKNPNISKSLFDN